MKISKKISRILFIIGIMLTVTSCGSQGVTSYDVDITMEGGSGKAYIESPVTVTESDGELTARLVWSSPNYDYMIVDGVKYDNETPGEASSFTVPVATLEEPLTVIGDTVAMSTPHEIEYVIYWGGRAPAAGQNEEVTASSAGTGTGYPADPDAVSFAELKQTGTMDLQYAERFSVTGYGDYKLIHIDEAQDYLLVPEGAPVPRDIPEGTGVLKMPLDATYMVSTSAMDLVSRAGALDSVRMSSLEKDEWHVDEIRSAMEDGDIIYAGKYRAPDYELIMGEGCDLAVENTMIFHEPAVKEKLEELGIPVIVEMSSYETHPLGRLEWIRFYGVLFGTEETADRYFEEAVSKAGYVMDQPDTGLDVAFFHVTAAGMINVRKPGDYISKMIEMSGGHYIIKDSEDDSMLSTMNIQMEDFYAAASDADVLIYNSTIGGEIHSLDELVEKNELFASFDAVRSGRVYCTSEDFFQKTTGMADFMNDLHNVLTGNEEDLVYLKAVR